MRKCMEGPEEQGVRIFVVLGRRLLGNILTVYGPTVLLNIMGHITVYFKPFFFEAIITVNLTVMLVLTTMSVLNFFSGNFYSYYSFIQDLRSPDGIYFAPFQLCSAIF